MKLLICPGLPRCGTTYLFEQFAKSGLFNVPHRKETNYFIGKSYDEGAFASLYSRDVSSRYYLDFSPSYLVAPGGVDHIISASRRLEIKIILCLRQPVERAFAHYLHDVRTHVATRDWGENVYYPLFCATALRRYLIRRAPAIRALADAIGHENIFVVNFHRDFNDLPDLRRRLAQFLGVAEFSLLDTVVGGGGWIPRYLYGEMDIVAGNDIRTLPSETLLLVNGPYSVIWSGVPREQALTLLNASTSWQHELTSTEACMLDDLVCRDDFAEMLSILGIDTKAFPENLCITAQSAELSQNIAELLPLRCTYRDRISEVLGLHHQQIDQKIAQAGAL